MPGVATVAFYIEYDGHREQLPINPAVLPISKPGANESAEIIGYGEITIPRKPKLMDIEIVGLFPANPNRPKIETVGNFKPPSFYIGLIDTIRKAKKPMRFVAAGLNIAGLFTIEDFKYSHIAADSDMHYTLTIKEYRAYQAKVWQPKVNVANKIVVPAKKETRSNTTGKITTSATVIVNGRLHLDSDGRSPGKTLTNYKGKVNFIKKSKGYPYHITTMDGAWLGWVLAKAVKLT